MNLMERGVLDFKSKFSVRDYFWLFIIGLIIFNINFSNNFENEGNKLIMMVVGWYKDAMKTKKMYSLFFI